MKIAPRAHAVKTRVESGGEMAQEAGLGHKPSLLTHPADRTTEGWTKLHTRLTSPWDTHRATYSNLNWIGPLTVESFRTILLSGNEGQLIAPTSCSRQI